ncbi:hypothetical protein U879_14645 [Defluviimonas sp. 20V17]|uniref:Uncharacterized protein n=1 Tax=Allgaiera indica TaxID=765699 RepID=A0AAN4UR10_9RHOB|nr:hypothetical protein [Allgaiera indica]KDB02913.1 hypothetical protein U879_14645 [Defluviimonas sp. 20V17]GHE01496.1 hypothetical protein GCM10008024_17200 [Allgaiera indica]SDW87822.1 hypothetical protein SAMN05444006_107183 [Allgaiera indica]
MPRILLIEADLPGAAPGETERLCWQQLNAVHLRRIQPVMVICPLLARDFDAIEVIDRLGRLKWHGALHVLFPALPNPGLVRRELLAFARDHAPAMSVETLEPEIAAL